MPPLAARVLLAAVSYLVAAAAQPAPMNATLLCGAPPGWAPALRGSNGTNRSTEEGRRLSARPASAWLHYDGAGAAPQPGAWYTTFTPRDSAEATYFSTNAHGFGYMGLQQVTRRWFGGFQGQAIFSIWDAGCSPEERAQVVECGRLARCGRFGGEGTGVQTFLALNNWQLGRSYGFLVEAADLGGGMVRYDGYFFAEELGGWNLLSKIMVSSAGKPWYLHGMGSFVEQWTTGGSGAQRWGEFGPSYLEQAGGFQGWTQITSATFDTSHGPQEDWSHTFATVASANGVETWGMGFGGSLPAGQPGTVLEVQPWPYDLPGPLRQYIGMRSGGQLARGCAGRTCSSEPGTALSDVWAGFARAWAKVRNAFRP